MRSELKSLMLSALLQATLYAAPTIASPTFYYDRAAFLAATTPSAGENFNEITAPVVAVITTYDIGDFVISRKKAGFPIIVDTATFPTLTNYEIDKSKFLLFNLDTLGAFFPRASSLDFYTPVIAFGADFRSINDEDSQTKISLDGVLYDIPEFPLFTSELSFLGFTTDSAVQSVEFIVTSKFSTQTDKFGIDNLVYTYEGGVESPMPDPTTWTTMILGLGLVGAIARCRRRGHEGIEALPGRAR